MPGNPSRRRPRGRAESTARGRRRRWISLLVGALALLVVAACGMLEPTDPGDGDGTAPSVASSVPADGATGVPLNTSVTATLDLPNAGAGVDAGTLSTDSVRLYRSSDEAPVAGDVSAGAAGDSIRYEPSGALEPETNYTFEVTSAVRDESGAAFELYRITFTTGSTTTETPSVTSSVPADGATGVYLDTMVTTTLHLPNPGAGVDAASLSTSSVRLYRTSDGAPVAGGVATSGGRDSILYQPFDHLQPETSYTFEVTSSVRDEAGASFAPYAITFTTGSDVEAEPIPGVSFSKEQVYSGSPISTLVIGPDERLYASTLNGRVIRWDIAGDGTLTNEAIYQGLAGRPIIGLVFDPLDDDVLWVTHNASLFVTPAEDFTGRIARITLNHGTFSASSYQDYVVGLPRSVKDHLTNSLAFGPDGNLYLTQGGNTATGAADSTWGFRPERLLSAAVLRIDPRRTTGLPIDVTTAGGGGSYDPYATNAPVQIYATGLRNAYDLVWHSNGSLYVPTNGSNAGGVAPASPDGSVPALDPVWTQPDFIYRVVEGGYYGHPNPARGEYVLNGGNPTGTMVNGDEVLPHSTGGVDYVGYPVGTEPDDNYRGFAWRFCCNDSTNGVIEYRSDTFGGALAGKVLLVRFAKGFDIVALDANPDGTLSQRRQLMGGFTRPLNLVEDLRNGNLYVAELVTQSEDGGRIQLLRAEP